MNIKKQIANIFTLTNLSLGLVSILIAAGTSPLPCPNKSSTFCFQMHLLAAFLIILAAILDRFDGKIARRTDTVSDLGKQLDSLSDLVSFGVAPAVLTWKFSLIPEIHRNIPAIIFLYFVVLLYPLCGALRLAKFNIQEDPSYFVGIPITLAGAITAILQIISLFYQRANIGNSRSLLLFLLVLIILLAGLMVSPFRLKKR